MSKNYTLGRGRVFFDPFVVGTFNKTGERYIGNTPEFNVTIESENLEHFDSDAGVRVKDDSVLLELNRTASIITDNIDPENVALFLLGATNTQVQTSGTVTGESLAAQARKGRFYQLGVTAGNPSGVRNVSAVTVLNGVTTLVAGTDYVLDATLGRIELLTTSATINEANALTASYTRAAANRRQIITAANAEIAGALRFISTNPRGTLLDYYMPYVRLTPNGDYALKGDDWQQMGFGIEILKLNDTTEAIYVDGRPFTP